MLRRNEEEFFSLLFQVRERRNPIVRSLSLDTIDTASHGFVVSENWFSYEQRFRTLKCLHDKNDKMVKFEIDICCLSAVPNFLSAYTSVSSIL